MDEKANRSALDSKRRRLAETFLDRTKHGSYQHHESCPCFYGSSPCSCEGKTAFELLTSDLPSPNFSFGASDAQLRVHTAMGGEFKLAIVGSTELSVTQTRQAAKIIHCLILDYKPTLVVSGGAIGVDSMSKYWAEALGINTRIFRPAAQCWPEFRKRNLLIAQECDALVRIVRRDSKTYGSGWTRDRAKEMGKPTMEFVIG